MGRAQQRKKKGKERLDRYYHLAKEQGFRARSAFKLIQLAQKYDLFTGCRVAVDLCAAPGGWMQVCARHMPVSSLVIGVDLAPIQPIKGCTSFQGDITTQECRAKIRKLLAGQEADLFLHDGSPNMGMDWSIDAFNQNVLVLHAAHLASEFLRKGGTFVSKVFRSSDYASLLYVLQQLFTRVEATKPQASRNVSAEIFVVCKGFKQPDRVDSRLFDPKFAFLSVDDEAEEKSTQQEQVAGGITRTDGEEEESAALALPQKAKVKLAEAFANAQKRRRGGYDSEETRYKVLTIGAFFASASPVESLLSASELVKSGESSCDDALEQTVLSHRLTTPEIKSLWSDLKVLGKRELSQLLKWRFKIKREMALQQKQQRLTTSTEGVSGEEQTEATAEDEEEGVEQQIDEELETLHASVSRQALRQQRKAAKKQRLLQTKQQFSRNAFAASERDPDLFAFTEDAAAAFKKEQQTVDAQLLLTGGEEENEGQHDANLLFSDNGIISKSKSNLRKEDLGVVEDDSDLDSVDRMEIDLEVGLRLRAMTEAARRGSKPQTKEKKTRRARVIEERLEELKTVNEEMQSRALKHLSDERENEENDFSDEEEETENNKHPNKCKLTQQPELPHEYFDEHLPEALKAVKPAAIKPSTTNSNSSSSSSSSSSGKGREAQVAARWFSQPLISDAVDEVAEALLAEEFDPVIQQQQQQQQQQEDEEESEEEEMKELEDAELPQIPLSEKQKRQQQRRREEQKKAAREARRVGGSFNPDEETAADEKSHRIEEVPATVLTPPKDAEEAATLQAMGAMLIRRSSRMDLIDGAYNRYAFNDDALPEWFTEDEEKHNKPELPVTKELMREYRRTIKEINSRPIRKVQEAKARKKKRALRVLEKVKQQAQGIADSSELSEGGKAKAIARLSRKAQQATARKQKSLIISRRVGGGKAAQKTQGKGSGGSRGIKFVDRRLKKDKRAAQCQQKKGKRKGVKTRKGGKGGSKRR